ncbi:hypothetical protein CEN49_25860 [Fischerella thermalis CCMEE 5273]|nr:hypothetical protein CEN49_25860 [Fischerella thermalis CCMEE 5273]
MPNQHACFKVNVDTEKKKEILHSDAFLSKLEYDKSNQSIIAAISGNIDREMGFFEISTKGINKQRTGPVRSNHLYSNGKYVVLDNDQIFTDKNGEILGEWGIFDKSKKEFILKEKVFGDFRAITGYGNKAYITTFGSVEKRNSNVYEVDLTSFKMRAVFNKPERRTPKVYFNKDGQSFGFYNHWDDFGPRNAIVSLDLRTASKELVADLPPYAYDMVLVNDYAVVIHYDENNGMVNISKPITIVNLETNKVSRVEGINSRPTDIAVYNSKVVITDDKGFILLLNPMEGKLEKRIQVTSTGLYQVTVPSNQ